MHSVFPREILKNINISCESSTHVWCMLDMFNILKLIFEICPIKLFLLHSMWIYFSHKFWFMFLRAKIFSSIIKWIPYFDTFTYHYTIVHRKQDYFATVLLRLKLKTFDTSLTERIQVWKIKQLFLLEIK